VYGDPGTPLKISGSDEVMLWLPLRRARA
jgi:hypothetical protein